MTTIEEYHYPIFRINESIITDSKEVIKYDNLNTYIADEIRKAVNNDSERLFISYSKSLTVCLLKYNELHNGDLHICLPEYVNYVSFYDTENYLNNRPIVQTYNIKKTFNFYNHLLSKEIIISTLCIKISNNRILNQYLINNTSNRIGLKTYASPEKDKELLLYKPKNVFNISSIHMGFVYLLYSLAVTNNLRKIIVNNLLNYINDEDNDFNIFESGNSDKTALLLIIEYLYRKQKFEKNEYNRLSKGRGYVGPRLECGAYSDFEYILDGDLKNVLIHFNPLSEFYSNLERELLYLCKKYISY